jgi:hypothetical protein
LQPRPELAFIDGMHLNSGDGNSGGIPGTVYLILESSIFEHKHYRPAFGIGIALMDVFTEAQSF